jgi:hypothetical protein
MGGTVIFDARAATFGLPLLPAALCVLAACAAAVLLLWLARRRRPAAAYLSLGLALLMMSLVALWVMLAPFALRRQAADAFAHGHVQTLEGCVTDFRYFANAHVRRSGPVTAFSLAGRKFDFEDTVLNPGFRNWNRAIHPDDRLRMTMSGDTVLMIERVPGPCSAPAR